MAVFVRTDYNKVPIGGNDPLWTTGGGVHTAPGRASVQADPLDGNKRALRLLVKPGDTVVSSGGRDRAEVMSNHIGGTEGHRIQVCFSLLLEDVFMSPSSSASLFDFHHPNTGVAQSSITCWCNSGGQLNLRLWGGPENSDHTAGTVRFDQNLGGPLQKMKWHEIVIDTTLSSDPNKGTFAFYLNGQAVFPERKFPVLPQGSRNVPVYWKQGHYRSAANYDATYWFRDTYCFRNTNADEALAVFGATAPPPPPSEPTNAQLVAEAVAELKQTTVGYRNKFWETPKTGMHWRTAFDLLAKIK